MSIHTGDMNDLVRDILLSSGSPRDYAGCKLIIDHFLEKTTPIRLDEILLFMGRRLSQTFVRILASCYSWIWDDQRLLPEIIKASGLSGDITEKYVHESVCKNGNPDEQASFFLSHLQGYFDQGLIYTPYRSVSFGHFAEITRYAQLLTMGISLPKLLVVLSQPEYCAFPDFEKVFCFESCPIRVVRITQSYMSISDLRAYVKWGSCALPLRVASLITSLTRKISYGDFSYDCNKIPANECDLDCSLGSIQANADTFPTHAHAYIRTESEKWFVRKNIATLADPILRPSTDFDHFITYFCQKSMLKKPLAIIANRDDAYSGPGQSFRNTPISDFDAIINWLLYRGYFVVRINSIGNVSTIVDESFIDIPRQFPSVLPIYQIHLMSQAELIIANDTGISEFHHLAAVPALYLNSSVLHRIGSPYEKLQSLRQFSFTAREGREHADLARQILTTTWGWNEQLSRCIRISSMSNYTLLQSAKWYSDFLKGAVESRIYTEADIVKLFPNLESTSIGRMCLSESTFDDLRMIARLA